MKAPGPASPPRARTLLGTAEDALYALATICCLAAMLGITIVGLLHLFEGIREGMHLEAAAPDTGNSQKPSAPGITKCLHALEYFLLAPLPYFLISALIAYRGAYEGRVRSYRQQYGSFTPDPSLALLAAVARRELAEVKSLIASLLAGIVAADMIDRILRPSPKGTEVLIELAVFLVLCGYYFALHHHVKQLAAEENSAAFPQSSLREPSVVDFLQPRLPEESAGAGEPLPGAGSGASAAGEGIPAVDAAAADAVAPPPDPAETKPTAAA